MIILSAFYILTVVKQIGVQTRGTCHLVLFTVCQIMSVRFYSLCEHTPGTHCYPETTEAPYIKNPNLTPGCIPFRRGPAVMQAGLPSWLIGKYNGSELYAVSMTCEIILMETGMAFDLME